MDSFPSFCLSITGLPLQSSVSWPLDCHLPSASSSLHPTPAQGVMVVSASAWAGGPQRAPASEAFYQVRPPHPLICPYVRAHVCLYLCICLSFCLPEGTPSPSASFFNFIIDVPSPLPLSSSRSAALAWLSGGALLNFASSLCVIPALCVMCMHVCAYVPATFPSGSLSLVPGPVEFCCMCTCVCVCVSLVSPRHGQGCFPTTLSLSRTLYLSVHPFICPQNAH